jgi:hypothetical protein
MNTNFFKSPTAAGLVTAASFAASAAHIVTVVAETNPVPVAAMFPIGIDVLMFVGIRALQNRRWFSGSVALIVGASYSFLFNADAENAIKMSPYLIAAAMPICFLASILIESTAKKAEQVEEPVQAVATVPTQTEFERMNERVETRLRAEHALTMETMKAEFEAKFAAIDAKPEPVKVRAEVTKPEPVKAITSKAAGTRAASWDVEKAIVLLADGRTNEEIAETVGTNAKAVQRTRRAVRLLTEDASRTDAEIGTIAALSAAHIERVRKALAEKE